MTKWVKLHNTPGLVIGTMDQPTGPAVVVQTITGLEIWHAAAVQPASADDARTVAALHMVTAVEALAACGFDPAAIRGILDRAIGMYERTQRQLAALDQRPLPASIHATPTP